MRAAVEPRKKSFKPGLWDPTMMQSAPVFNVSNEVRHKVDQKLEKVREARIRGYEGDSCSECGNFTLVRNGTCLKCDTCGSTSGCS